MSNEQVQYALDRMCTPLHESRLSGVAAREDARCMALIRAEIERLRADLEAAQAEIVRLKEHQRLAMHDPDVCNGRIRGEPPRYVPECVAQQSELEAQRVLNAALTAKLEEVHCWIVCAPIASPEDMMQNAERIEQITRTNLCTYPACDCNGPAADGGCAALAAAKTAKE